MDNMSKLSPLTNRLISDHSSASTLYHNYSRPASWESIRENNSNLLYLMNIESR